MSLKEYWYIAAEGRELKRRPLSVELYGNKLVLFRSADGRTAALEDRCAHRNTELSRGHVESNCIECPYHGWQYDLDGRCVHVPSLGDGARIPRHSVRSFPVREQGGFLWVYLGEKQPTSDPFHFPHSLESGWTSFCMKTRFTASVEACLENFLDCPHTVYVHKGWFRTHDTRKLQARVRSNCGSVEVEFGGEPISDSVVSRLFFPKGRELRHTDRFLMPSISRVDYDFGPDRHFIITSQCTPINESETQVYTVITYRFGIVGLLVRLALEPICRKIIRQDVDILKLQAEQLRRFGGPRFAHVDTDLLGLRIQSMRRRAEGSEAYRQEGQSEREITICF